VTFRFLLRRPFASSDLLFCRASPSILDSILRLKILGSGTSSNNQRARLPTLTLAPMNNSPLGTAVLASYRFTLNEGLKKVDIFGY